MVHGIRRLTIDDYDDIIHVWSVAGLPIKPRGRESRDHMTDEFTDSHSAFLGLEREGQLIAVGIANYDGRKGWINRVAVDPDFRGEGICGQIIEACEEFLYEKGAQVIAALIEDINYPSISCFQRAGYSHLSEIKYFSKRPSSDA